MLRDMNDAPERLRFLVADDAPLVAVLVGELLLEAGVDEVRSAADGAEALRLFRQTAPDGVVLDIHMPQLGGLDVLRAIRSSPPPGSEPPLVIVMTSHDEPALREHAMAAGADHFLHKSSEIERLLEIVPGLMARRASCVRKLPTSGENLPTGPKAGGGSSLAGKR
jgi:CheY-like chemotaxis protein